MGQEISTTHLKQGDFHRFAKQIECELEILHSWFREAKFSDRRSISGLELEAWLVDADNRPAPWNEQVIARTGIEDVVPELSRFNLEFNVAPQALAGQGLAALAQELRETWLRTESAANQLGASVVAIGILPTVTDPMLTLANMSKLHRYRALNEQVLRLRQGKPIKITISGYEELFAEHRDVMLESATTSFQLHLQVPLREAVRYYNASMIASAAIVAATSNSPFLFGKMLWDETRIPLFEQALRIGGDTLPRVTFGSDYARDSLEEVFRENQEYPVLLPMVMDERPERLAHVRLLNGTIWRWNRPLIGFDDDGTPHLRIEHRVMPAGPTAIDMTANMALFFGLVENLARESPPVEARLPFTAARDNFYRAAQHGLECSVQWLDDAQISLRNLLLDELLPRAAQGLKSMRVDGALERQLLAVIEERIRSGQTGAVWQRRYVERHGSDFAVLIQAYRDRQQSNEPVHTWTFDRRDSSNSVKLKRSMLRIVDKLPTGLIAARAADLAELLGGPTLIHLPGRREKPLFASILLHGNEDVGLKALQSTLRKYAGKELPRALSIFVGNVDAAREGMRYLPGQPDYNRIWPEGDDDGTPEHAMMRHVVAEMRERGVFASVDFHSNSGLNPYYACVTHLNDENLQLATLFGRTAVFFQRPRGVQTMAFSEFCPSVTCECGKVGDKNGAQHAADFLDACLHLSEVPQHPLAEGDLHLFHTVAIVKVPPGTEFAFASIHTDDGRSSTDLTLRSDLDQLNFQELSAGTCLGWIKSPSVIPLRVTDQFGHDVTGEFLKIENGRVFLRTEVIPAMLTCNIAVVRQDCLGYFMERYPLS